MTGIKNLKLDLEIAWYWALCKYQQATRNQKVPKRELLMVKH
ncbi:MAG: hypothetical protein R3327_00545 [Nitrosopumilaceae archaeon]|nr:hypothetical protein [Nitrosopumilaceae archaeon]